MLQQVLKATISQVSFFHAVKTEWNNLDISIRNLSSMNMFKKCLLKFIEPESNLTYNIYDTERLKLLPRFSHLGYHKFNHNILNSLCPICICGQDIETISNFLLHYPPLQCSRKPLFQKMY